MNSDVMHESDCVYYDKELRILSRNFKECYNILKDIEKRADRKETVQISKSLFDYVELSKAVEKFPQIKYDFKFDDVRVYISKINNCFVVNVVGFQYFPQNVLFDVTMPESWHYEIWCRESYDSKSLLKDAVDVYLHAINYFLYQIKHIDMLDL